MVQEKLLFLAGATPNIIENLQACEKILQEHLITKLLGKDNISHQLRDIASLPLKMSGLNIKLPSDYENFLEWSIKTSLVLVIYDPITAISEQEKFYKKLISNLKETKRELLFLNNLSDSEKYALELTSKKEALNCLNVLPLM